MCNECMCMSCERKYCSGQVQCSPCLLSLMTAELVETWREVAQCHAKVSGALDKALEREHGIGLSEFEVLERLATTEDADGAGACRISPTPSA